MAMAAGMALSQGVEFRVTYIEIQGIQTTHHLPVVVHALYYCTTNTVLLVARGAPGFSADLTATPAYCTRQTNPEVYRKKYRQICYTTYIHIHTNTTILRVPQ